MNNRPDNIEVYDELDWKLGIKSSLPHIKSTLALVVLLWECAGKPAELLYSKQNGNSIEIADGLAQKFIEYYSRIYGEHQIDNGKII